MTALACFGRRVDFGERTSWGPRRHGRVALDERPAPFEGGFEREGRRRPGTDDERGSVVAPVAWIVTLPEPP